VSLLWQCRWVSYTFGPDKHTDTCAKLCQQYTVDWVRRMGLKALLEEVMPGGESGQTGPLGYQETPASVLRITY